MNKIRVNLRKYSCFLLCYFLFFALFPTSVIAKETKSKVVRVGWYEDSYNITGKNGERSGYNYEYEQTVADYTGWTYKYVKAGWPELMEMLEKGEIDLMGDVSYTDERAKTMLFSELPMGEEKYYLYADLVNTDISASDLSTLNGKRIGLLKGSVQETQFYEWEKEHNVHMQHVFMTGLKDAMQKVAHQELDCIISTETPQWTKAGMSAITTIGSSGIYFAVNKKRPDLKEELDSAMRKLENDRPFYSDDLYKNFLSTVSSPVLSSEEKDWIDEHGAIRISYLKKEYGFSEINTDSGKLVGVINDYIKFAADCLGKQTLKFKTVGFDSLDEQMQALKDDKIDMIFHFIQNPYIAEENGFALSNTVLTVNMAAVTAKDYFNENKENSVAIDKNNLLLKWRIAYNYPDWEIVECDSIQDAEKAVKDKKVDCLLVDSGRVEKYIENNKFHNVFLTKSSNVSFAVNRGDTILLSILNKTLKTMQSSMLTGALSMYDNASKKVTVIDFVKDNLLAVTTAISIIFMVILLVILSSLKKAKDAETKAKQAANQSQELNEKLQENHRELEKALLRAENANSAKTTFLNNMSHDMRTPMNAIMGFTNIALKHVISNEVKDCLEKINDSSELLLTLINDVLDISRIESGHMKIRPAIIDITEVTDGALNVASGLLTHRDLNFEVNRTRPENPYVLADSIRIREILVNILSNAIKFTNDGGTIKFITESKFDINKNKLMVRYVVSDTGIGMSEEFQKHIFDEFAQEESDARTQYKGTGLGMSITKNYIDMMGGSISLQSKKNKGTTFVIEIPFKAVKKEKVQNRDNVIDSSDIKGIHVLLAEDNDLNAEIAIVQLEEAGMKVTRAVDGKDVVDIFVNHPQGTFDIILMDIMMPNMNGYQATEAIRKLTGRPDGKTIPIIALTANAFAEDVQASFDAGMSDHVSKPIIIEEVIKTILRNISK